MRLLLALAAFATVMLSSCGSYTPIRTHFNKGAHFYSQENYEGAIREYRLALEEDPLDHRARFNLAVSLEAMEETAAARAEYEAILAQNPDDLRANINLAVIEIEANETESGHARLARMIALHPTLPAPRIALATQHFREGREAEAEALARQGLALDSTDVEANHLLAEILVRRATDAPVSDGAAAALLDEAREKLRLVLKYEPDDLAALLTLGRLERRAGNVEASRGFYRRVLLQKRTSLEAHLALAAIAEESGEHDLAVHHLWQARALDPKHPELANVSERLVHLYEILRREESEQPETRLSH